MTYPSPEPAVTVILQGKVLRFCAGRPTSGGVQGRVVESHQVAHHGCAAGLRWNKENISFE